jgi:hypothetical protein
VEFLVVTAEAVLEIVAETVTRLLENDVEAVLVWLVGAWVV